MLLQPFKAFRPFETHFRIALLTKKDAVSSDEKVIRVLGPGRMASLRQVHGNRTLVVRTPMQRTEEGDGMLTDARDLWLTVRTADCQPIVLYHPGANVAGVLHVGWKGLLNSAIPAFLRTLAEEWDADPAGAYVAIGPSLCARCAEFSDPLRELPGIDPRFIRARTADLPGIADDQLKEAGIQPNRIERSPDCTKCLNDRYWSYRGGDREKVMEGWTNVLACVLT